MTDGNDELVASFVEEASEFLPDVENDFLAIEEAGAAVDIELVNKVFRGIHSMKGSAGFLGLKSIGTLAHEMENVLNLIRNNELVPNHVVAEALLRSADTLRGMVNNVESSNGVDVSGHINELKAAVSGGASAETQEALNRDVDISLPEGGLAFVMVKEMELVLRQRQGCHIYVVEVDFLADVHERGHTPLEFLKGAYAHGELIDSYMSTAGIGDLSSGLPDSLLFMMIFGSKLLAEGLAQAMELPSKQVHHIATPSQMDWKKSGPQEPGTGAAEAPAGAVSVEQSGPSGSSASGSDAGSTAKSGVQPSESSVGAASDTGAASGAGPTTGNTMVQANLRVSIKVLDTLMNLAGELVLGRNQLLQEAASKDHRGIESVAARIDQVTSELQEAIMQTRMQPIGTVFNKFPRIVRDLSGKLAKQCELTVEGRDVEMDKTIIEAISDPLTHLIRNSVDHGVEKPQERVAQGKNEMGGVVLRAYHEAGKVNISISDDGAGVDCERLKEKALEKGIITPEQSREMSQRDAVRLIFHPGFSMAQKVTDVSGRGVGMDVVKTNIEKLGGTVDVDTEIGKGTTIIIKLPLTLAIIPSLIVRCGENRFAIPQVNISELVRIKASEVAEKIERLKDAEVLRLRGILLPLVRLSSTLDKPGRYRKVDTDALRTDERSNIADRRSDETSSGYHRQEKRTADDRRSDTCPGALNIIVVETGALRYGLIVDELYDSKEIVVKPLGKHMKDCQCLAGATILGDGKVALILDVAGIAGYQHLTMPDSEIQAAANASQSRQEGETQSVLVFTNDPHEYFGVPTEFVARIERIRAEQIDSVGGQEVLQYRGASLALLSLEKLIKAEPRPKASSLFVVVFKISGREVGLISPDLVDICRVPTDVDTETFREKGVVGSTILDKKTLRLLDVFELAKTAHPEWTVNRDSKQSRNDESKTILLAEDSSFFRQQMTNFLESEGYEVIACEDGLIAWNTLQDAEQEFRLVVTDIEMPNMNGLELAHKIKSDPTFAHLPIIAVTSLAGQEDVERGTNAGIDEYQVKLDRDELLRAIGRQCRESKAKV